MQNRKQGAAGKIELAIATVTFLYCKKSSNISKTPMLHILTGIYRWYFRNIRPIYKIAVK